MTDWKAPGLAPEDSRIRRAFDSLSKYLIAQLTPTSVALVEQTTNPSAVANTGVVFTKDNGAGKTQLCVRFATGAVQIISTEP